MNPNSHEIAKAKALLGEAGYLCVHIKQDTTWSMDSCDCIGGAGIHVELDHDDRQDAYEQMKAIKIGYEPAWAKDFK